MPKPKRLHARVSERLHAFIRSKAKSYYEYTLKHAKKDGYKPDQND